MTTLLDLLATPRRRPDEPPSRWLLNHLIARGHLTETGLTRRARLRTCDCGAWILAGLDDDTCALEATADPYPLTPLGEALARIEGRWTWSLRRDGRGYVLDRRHPLEIAAGPKTRVDVLREHICHSRQLADAETSTTAFVEARPTVYDTPPF